MLNVNDTRLHLRQDLDGLTAVHLAVLGPTDLSRDAPHPIPCFLAIDALGMIRSEGLDADSLAAQGGRELLGIGRHPAKGTKAGEVDDIGAHSVPAVTLLGIEAIIIGAWVLIAGVEARGRLSPRRGLLLLLGRARLLGAVPLRIPNHGEAIATDGEAIFVEREALVGTLVGDLGELPLDLRQLRLTLGAALAELVGLALERPDLGRGVLLSAC
jgi:hypothetical protein